MKILKKESLAEDTVWQMHERANERANAQREMKGQACWALPNYKTKTAFC